MSDTALSSFAQSRPPAAPISTPLVVGVLAVWFVLVFLAGANGAFVRPPGKPPLPMLIGVAGPFLAFLGGYWASPAFRAFVRALDQRVATAIQAWRFAGLGFIALYAHGILPGMFAWPAGLGDIAMGVTAPWVLATLLRRPGFAGSRLFVLWNLFGILDLVVAVGTGLLSSVLAAGIPGEVTTAPMAQLPLVLIPAYFVPLLAMLHLAALIQARRFAASGHSD